MSILLLGLASACLTGACAVVALVRGLPEEQRAYPRSWKLSVWVQIGLVVLGTFVSCLMLHLQYRSATQREARLSQLNIDQERLVALLMKQEVVRDLSLRISPLRCVPLNSTQPLVSHVVEVMEQTTGQKPGPEETAILGVFIQYGALWIDLIGQGRMSGTERWFYAVGFEGFTLEQKLLALPIPFEPNAAQRVDLVDLRLNDNHLKEFVTSTPLIQDVIQRLPFMGEAFDPRSELGFFTINISGLYRGSYDLNRLPPQNLGTMPGWREVKIPVAYSSCWDVDLMVNHRRIANLMKADGLLTAERAKMLSWPGRVLDRDKKGLVWLAPLAHDWSEFKPVMNCRVAWLLYGGASLPCRIGKPRP